MNEIDRKISMFRLVDVKVINDNNEVLYEGPVDNAPKDIKDLSYKKLESNFPIIVHI